MSIQLGQRLLHNKRHLVGYVVGYYGDNSGAVKAQMALTSGETQLWRVSDTTPAANSTDATPVVLLNPTVRITTGQMVGFILLFHLVLAIEAIAYGVLTSAIR